VQILRGRPSAVDHLAISPDSRYVAAAGETELHLWDLHDPDADPTRHAVPTSRASSSYSLQFLSDGRLFNVHTGGWQLLDPVGGRVARRRRADHRALGAASPCGRFVLEYDYDSGLCCWRLSEDSSGLQRELVWSLPAAHLTKVPVFAPDSERFAAFSITLNPELVFSWTIRRTADGQPHPDLGADRVEFLSQGQFTPDGGKFLAGVRSHVLEWDVRVGGAGRIAVRQPSGRHFHGLAVHPDGAILAGTTNDTHLSLYDLASGGVLRSYDWRIGRLKHAAFTPDGTRCVVAGSSGKVLLFDVE